MIPGFGKQTITIGSAPTCDIRLGGPGVAPEHARLIHQGGGNLVFVDAGTGPTMANGAQIQPGASVPFDFRTQLVVGQVPIPPTHPAIALMLMEQGRAPLTPGQISFGRDPARNNIVINHPNVSSHHATIGLSPLTLTDHGSTAGTWLRQERIPA